MKLYSLCQLSQRAGVPNPSVCNLVNRGVLPRPDIRAGREGYYSEEAAAVVVHWLSTQYQRYVRYSPGTVQLPTPRRARKVEKTAETT